MQPKDFHPAHWWIPRDNQGTECLLCPRHCILAPDQKGVCFIRQNTHGKMVLNAYGKSTGFAVDPIEKKPLFHFLPGSKILSFGTIGCNLLCRFCQNWSISRAKDTGLLRSEALPEEIPLMAAQTGCKSVAFTYNEPIVFAEYVMETARICRKQNIKTVAVTAGYIEPSPRKEFFANIDAANVDLKGFSDKFYETICGGKLSPVLETLKYIAGETQIWLEITNLLIPGKNDDPEEIRQMCDWIADNLGDQVPLHFSAFHPDYHMENTPPTSLLLLQKAYEIGKRSGLKYVYTGNVRNTQGDTTCCPGCGKALLVRDWFDLTENHLRGNACSFCGEKIAGRFE